MPIAALVLGIVGLVLSLVPCLGMYAIPLTLIAVILGALGMKAPTGRGMAIAGLVCGIIGTCVAGWWIYAYLTVKSASEDGLKQLEKDLKAAVDKEYKEMKKGDDAAPAPAPAPATAPAPAAP
jgi:hypothetical protein